MPDDRRRARTLPWLFRLAVQATLAGGRVDTTPDLAGVALWVPSAGGLAAIERAAARSTLLVPLRLRGAYRRFRIYTESNFELQQRARTGAPTLFLSGLGVDPARQRQGVGGALLEAGLAREPHVAAALLTNNDRNVAFYERHGFSVLEAAPMPGGGPPSWAMVRRQPIPSGRGQREDL